MQLHTRWLGLGLFARGLGMFFFSGWVNLAMIVTSVHDPVRRGKWTSRFMRDLDHHIGRMVDGLTQLVTGRAAR